eukprot:scaffold3515_cov126-Cylindrotheca_fusiformis.AAC.14
MAIASTTTKRGSHNNTMATTTSTALSQKRDDVPVEEESVEEMPMDELKQDRKQEMMLCNVTDEVNDSIDDPNLCNYTFQAMGEICGVSSKPNNSSSIKEPKDVPREIPKHAFRTGADEHTSIEVEYVQPRLKKPVSKATAAALPVPENTTKKSLLLETISQKAREDYQKEVRAAPQEHGDDDYAQNTIYNSFSPPEKRKFIKLINMGISPSVAAGQVLKERQEGAVAAQEQARAAKGKKGLFRHFHKSKTEEDPEIPTTEFQPSGINYYDAVRKIDAEGYEEPDDEEIAIATKNKKKKSILPKFKKKRFSKLSGVEPKIPNNSSNAAAPAVTSSRSAPASTSPPNSRNNAAAGAVGAGVAAVATSRSAPLYGDDDDQDDPSDEDWMPPPPPSEHRAPLGASAMRSPIMTEEEVLRDLAMSDNGTDNREEKKAEEDMTALLLRPMKKGAKKQVPAQVSNNPSDLDDMETYLSSTDLIGGGAGPSDQMTVASGKSYKTSATTASSRSRRPGQAQRRLQQQRTGEIQNRKARPSSHQMRGWQETMQQAAAENNREWDPKLGWVDYANPGGDRSVPSATSPKGASVASPPTYDHRGRPMQGGSSTEVSRDPRKNGAAAVAAEGGSTTEVSRDPRKNGAAAVEPQQSTSWVESMKAASARLLQAGKKWDPEHGWMAVDASGQATPRHDDGKINTQSESDTADFGVNGGLLVEQDEKLMIYEDENSESEPRNGRYVQIGDTGSVHSHHGINKRNGGAPAPKRPSSLLVDVKKEKVDSDDAEYFNQRRSAGPVDLDELDDDDDDDEENNEAGGAVAVAPRSIPKLMGSKKDTTPKVKDVTPEVTDEKKEDTPQTSRATPVTPDADYDAGSKKGGVGKLSQMWESRSSAGGDVENTRKSSEWKSFLNKKQQAESEANRQRGNEDGAFPTGDLSPIRKDQDNASEVASEASTAAMQPNTFMGRLQACAAPMYNVGQRASGRFNPPAFCTREDAIHEEDDTTLGTETLGTETTPRSERPRSRSRPRSSKSDVGSVISDEMSGSKAAFLESMAMKAVVSSKKGRRRSAGSEAGGSVASTPRSSTGGMTSPRSSAGASTSDNKWQQFLERKKTESGNGSVMGARSQASSAHSRAAEKYAAKKIAEMTETQRSQSEAQGTSSSGNQSPGQSPGESPGQSPSQGPRSFQSRPMEEATGAFPKPARSSAGSSVSTPSRIRTSLPFEPPKSASQIAAEEAKAARLRALRDSISPRGQAS